MDAVKGFWNFVIQRLRKSLLVVEHKHMRQYFIHFFLFIHLLAAGCKEIEVRPSVPLPLEEQLMPLGNPSLATPDPSNYNSYLMMKPQYALSYSRNRGTANWVSWHINKDWIGDAPR